MAKKKNRVKTESEAGQWFPPKLGGIIFLVLVVLILPLPFSLYSAGIEWLFSGEGVSEDFIVTYVVGVVIELFSLGIIYFKEWRE